MGVCFSVDGTTGVAACERLIAVHAQRTKNRTQTTAETTAAASLRDLLNDNFTFPASVEKLGGQRATRGRTSCPAGCIARLTRYSRIAAQLVNCVITETPAIFAPVEGSPLILMRRTSGAASAAASASLSFTTTPAVWLQEATPIARHTKAVAANRRAHRPISGGDVHSRLRRGVLGTKLVRNGYGESTVSGMFAFCVTPDKGSHRFQGV